MQKYNSIINIIGYIQRNKWTARTEWSNNKYINIEIKQNKYNNNTKSVPDSTYLTKKLESEGKAWDDIFCEYNNKKLTAGACGGPLCSTKGKKISWYSFNQDHFILDSHHLLQIPVSLFLLTCCHESHVLFREEKRLSGCISNSQEQTCCCWWLDSATHLLLLFNQMNAQTSALCEAGVSIISKSGVFYKSSY